MKLRNKKDKWDCGVILYETPTHYLASSCSSESPVTAYSKRDYEPVPAEEIWEDVTEHCVVSREYQDGHTLMSHEGFLPHIIQVRKDYRLRKFFLNANHGAYFKVERRRVIE
jgi:hypothetical protein